MCIKQDFRAPLKEAETAKRQPSKTTGPRSTPRPSRAPWLLETANKKQQTDHNAGKRTTQDDTGAELGAEGLHAPKFARGGTAYYVGDDPMECSQAATNTVEAVNIIAESQGSEDERYEATSPSNPEGRPNVEAICTFRDTEAAADSPELQEDLIETAIDFSFATQDPPAHALRSHRHVAHRPVKAAAKSLVRSGLRCHKWHLRSWICLCDRAPVEIDRRGKASGHQRRYVHPCLLSKHCTTMSCLLATDQCMCTLSGLATPRKHARRVLALARSFSFLSHTACAGKSAKVKLSASDKRYYWLLQVLFRSIDGLINGRAGRARVPHLRRNRHAVPAQESTHAPADWTFSPLWPTAHKWGIWPNHAVACDHATHASGATHHKATSPSPRLCRGLILPVVCLPLCALDATNPWNCSWLSLTMQPGTPVGRERKYSWRAMDTRLVASTPQAETIHQSEDTQGSSEHPRGAPLADCDTQSRWKPSPGMPAKFADKPRPSKAPRLLVAAADEAATGSVTNSSHQTSPYAGMDYNSMLTPTPTKGTTAYYEEASPSDGSQEATGTMAQQPRTADAVQDNQWDEAASPRGNEGHTTTLESLGSTQRADVHQAPAAQMED